MWEWAPLGGFVIHDTTAAGEAGVIQTRFFDRLRSSVERVTAIFARRHGAVAATAALRVTARSVVGYSVDS